MLRELLDALLFVLIVLLVVAALVVPLVWTIAKLDCEASTARMELTHDFDIWAGCLVEVREDTWIPLRNYRWMEP